MKKVLYKAPIDNKNVLTDFTEVFHNGDCLSVTIPVGTNGTTHTYEYFVVENCLCCVSYVFGLNWFRVEVQQHSSPENYEKAKRHIEQCIENLYHDNVLQELIVKKDCGPGIFKDCTYEFYFLVQED